jgi:integral membrane sensor domain MASE1
MVSGRPQSCSARPAVWKQAERVIIETSPWGAVISTVVHYLERAALSSRRHENPPPILPLLVVSVSVTAAYVLSAHLGFRLAFLAQQVTTVWAPTGISLAALLLGGLRFWPAIWAGAFIANAGTDAPVWTAAIVATGNTLEAVAATWALRRLRDFDVRLQSVRGVLAFLFIAAVGATAISATIGVITLCAAAVQPWARFGALWFDWWLGDALGAIVWRRRF